MEYGKSVPEGAADTDTPQSKWIYFRQLIFLKEVIRPRLLTKNGKKAAPSDREAFPEEDSSGDYTDLPLPMRVKQEPSSGHDLEEHVRQGSDNTDRDEYLEPPDIAFHSTRYNNIYSGAANLGETQPLYGQHKRRRYQDECYRKAVELEEHARQGSDNTDRDEYLEPPNVAFHITRYNNIYSGAASLGETQPLYGQHKRRRYQDECYRKAIELDQQRTVPRLGERQATSRLASTESEDMDLMFLKTLLPHINLIPQHKKLRFQAQLMTVVESFAYGSGGTSEVGDHSSTSTSTPRPLVPLERLKSYQNRSPSSSLSPPQHTMESDES